MLRTSCPFCASAHVASTPLNERMMGHVCQSCGREWSEAPDRLDVPRATPAKVSPRCPSCGTIGPLRKETIVTSDLVREVYTCSHCQASWPIAGADKTA